MLNLIIASGNPHKAEEFQTLLDKNIFSISPANEKIDVVEDGETYFENAFKKASSYSIFTRTPVLADDSGLNVEALPKELGIFSARFGGEGLSDKQRALLLLEKMKDVPEEQRGAYFSCILCFYLNESEIFYFEGRVAGKIGYEYRGNDGFGYDPVFIPDGLAAKKLTFAQDLAWKHENSHRAKACQLANQFFLQRLS